MGINAKVTTSSRETRKVFNEKNTDWKRGLFVKEIIAIKSFEKLSKHGGFSKNNRK